MSNTEVRPRWAPRVPPALVQRLYESDARGLLDEDLLDDVGIRLYLRCQSIVTVHTVMHEGRLPCPVCSAAVFRDRTRRDADQLLRCDACGWELPWRDYWLTYRHNELAYDVWTSDYLSDWEGAKTPRQKMLAIDRVLHRWHNDTKEKRPRYGIGRPSGVNLLEGSRRQAIAFLDGLTASGQIESRHDASWRGGLRRIREGPNRRDLAGP